MNFIDIILIVPLLYAAWKGFKKGLIIEIFTLLALLVGIYAGIHFSDWTSGLIIQNIDIEGRYLPVVAFTLTFLAVGAMVYFLGIAIERVVKIAQLSLLNKLLGLTIGIIKSVYILSVIITIVETYDERGKFIPNEIKDESFLYYPIKNLASKTIPAIEQSSIWLKNSIENTIFEDQDFSLEEIQELKEKADSLGIGLQDVLKYKKMADSLGIDINDLEEYY